MNMPAHRPNRFQRGIMQVAAWRPVAWFLARTLRHLDRGVLNLSGGRISATTLLTGLPVIVLTTTGAKSGLPRSMPLICGIDGDRLVLFATNFGGAKNPAWYYNLRSHPETAILYRDTVYHYRAREATAAEREKYWTLADAMYIGYAAYRKRASHREIPIMVLEPLATSRAPTEAG
ncbi:MAG: nitroreductase family deazaflavin-dependent oxidoreductase [Caldilineaceae bacterium]|nr:nitroreductase family deazaflavin-dependent oxidoreductase [Caldilineaceae bacterium]